MKEINFKSIISNLIMIVTIVIAVALASTIFGSNNTLIWVAVVVAVMMYSKIGIGIECKQATAIVILLFWLIGLSNRLAMINPYIGILINFITIFLLVYIPSRRVYVKAYTPFMLCYVFGQSMATNASNFNSRVVSLLVGSIIVGIVYYVYNRKSNEPKIIIKDVFKNIDITSDRFILALKMAIGVTISMYIGAIFKLQKTLWIAVSTMSITQIDFEHTRKKFKHRIVSTIIGAAVFVVLFKWLIPDRYAMVATLVLSYLYSFVEAYNIQIIFITVNALSSAMILFDSVTAVWLRILLVISGCLVGYIVNRLNFKKIFLKLRNKSDKEIKKELN